MKNFHQSVTFLITLLALSSCATPGIITTFKAFSSEEMESRRALMVGPWYGEAKTSDGKIRKWLMDRHKDGTYLATFLTISPGAAKERQMEAGFWGIDSEVYFTMTRGMSTGSSYFPVDTTKAYFYDGYQITELTAETFRYRSLHGPDTFETKKVNPDFRLED